MAKKKKKQTPLQREYVKQRNRLKQAIKKAEKRGYIFEDDVLPKQPKSITRSSVERLQKIKPKDLYEKAQYVDKSTGEIVPGREGKYYERKEATRKAQQTRARKKSKVSPYTPPVEEYYPSFSTMVISNYRAHIRQFNDACYSLLNDWLERIIRSNGEDDTAEMLEQGAENGLIVTYKIAYAKDKLFDYMTDMLNYLPEAGDIFKEDIMQALEEAEDWESPQ